MMEMSSIALDTSTGSLLETHGSSRTNTETKITRTTIQTYKSPRSPRSPSSVSSKSSRQRKNSRNGSSRGQAQSLNPYSPIVSSCKHLLQPNGSILGSDVARTILPLFPSFCSAIPAEVPSSASKVALGSIDGRKPISHTRVRDFVLSEFGPSLHDLGYGRGDRIAVVLPNGPELALAIVSIANWASCVPLNATGARTELEMDLKGCDADLVIGPHCGPIPSDSMYENSERDEDHPAFTVPGACDMDATDFLAFDHVRETATKLGIPFVGLLPSKLESGIFELVPPIVIERSATPLQKRQKLEDEADAGAGNRSNRNEHTLSESHYVTRKLANSHDDEVLVLFTSGTTGTKKLVPHRLGAMLVATATICVSWDLTSSDVNCNLMPLFHVGGIVRQIFSPLLSGGCVICCPSFDPTIFWELMSKKAFTWYYAAPTMHQIILATGKEKTDDPTSDCTLTEKIQPKLRMIANAAGGLLPSLAVQLRDTFHANVLPSYGMTECMPISSPPANYELERPGTSGVAVGPEIAILDLKKCKSLPVKTEGPICVRGAPCFGGYGHNSSSTEVKPMEAKESFLKGGWFNTGDLGYLDEDGYLYITGRSKEVINRGGEIISPLEVEEAVVSHPDVVACAAFSAKHDVLQEVVGMVIIPNKERPRIDLRSLHCFLGQERLAAPKWPQCLVFMDDLPKSNTNKLLRVKLGDRLGLHELNDGLHPLERTYEARCPPKGTSVHTPIPCNQVRVDTKEVENKLYTALSNAEGHANVMFPPKIVVTPHPTRLAALVCYLVNVKKITAVEAAESCLDKYAIPTHFVSLDENHSLKNLPPPESSDSTSAIKQDLLMPGPSDPLVKRVQELFMELLDLDCLPHPDTNFFNLGGSSMLASQLASKVRKHHGVPFSGAEVFHHSSSRQMANVIRERKESNADGDSTVIATDQSSASVGSRKDLDMQDVKFSSKRQTPDSNICKSIFHMIPLMVIYPVWLVTRFFLFFSLLLFMVDTPWVERSLFKFIITVIIFHSLWVTITPLLFVLIKWTVIGRYQAGRYPLWGSYYMRWWFVEVLRKMIGRGIYGSNEELLNIYYRMLGASIGRDARIAADCDIAEYDLVSIGNNAVVDNGTVRGFALDNGCMLLGTAKVGDGAGVCVKAIVAPNTAVPDNAHLGPQASSYEIGKSADPINKEVNRQAFPQPNMILTLTVGNLITFLVDFISYLPSLVVFYWMVSMPWHHDEPLHTYGDMLAWLCDPRRIPFYIALRVTRQLVNPIAYMITAILMKKLVIGKFKAGPVDTSSQWQLLRHWLAEALFTRENLLAVTEIIGRHYELVSIMYRLLGAKIGKRVFWPGSQFVFTGEFDLLEIGDDVVFGSRSVIYCRTSNALYKVRMCAGSNVADNCVILPGVVMGKNAVLGSSGIAPVGWYFPESSVWFGSTGCEPVLLERGPENENIEADEPMMASKVSEEKLVMTGDDSTMRPFGKAIYKREASYYVWPITLIVLFGIIVTTFHAALNSIFIIAALQAVGVLLYGIPVEDRLYDNDAYSGTTIYTMLVLTYIIAHSIHILLWLGVEVGTKWGLIGRREEGRYNYDSSTYNQRWELYQLFTRVRRLGRITFFDFLHGTPQIASFFRMLGCQIGTNACLYPAGGDPYMPEPDLVTIGNNCAVDNAALVCHLNTRGNFELVPIVLGDNVTLRNRSRIQMGCQVESGSMLLEHSLAMTGEVIESDSVWQGAPATPVLYFTNSATPQRTSSNDQYDPDPLGGTIV